MKLTLPADWPFAVEVPDLAAVVSPGETVEAPKDAPVDVIASLLCAGWEAADADAGAVVKQLEQLDKAEITGTIEERALLAGIDQVADDLDDTAASEEQDA